MKENNQWHFHIKQRDLIILVVLGLILFISSGIGSSDTDEPFDAETTTKINLSELNSVNNSTGNVKFKTISTDHKFGVNDLGEPYIKVIVVLENTSNFNLYLSDERIDISDETGHLIATQTASARPYVVAPGERSVIYQFVFSENLQENVQYKIDMSIDIKKFNGKYQRLSVSDLSISETRHGIIQILGRIKNTTSEEQSLYYAVATLYDDKGNVLACFSTSPDALDVGEERSFEMRRSFSDFSLSDVASYTVIAYPYQYQY